MTKKELGRKIYEIERNNPMGVYYGHFSKEELQEEIEAAKKRAERKIWECKGRCQEGVSVLGKGTTMEAAIFSMKATAKKTGLYVKSIYVKDEVGTWKKI